MKSISSGTSIKVPQHNHVQNSTDAKKVSDEFSETNSILGNKSEVTPSVYIPHWITGGAKHPGLIVETPGLANVAPPPVTSK